MREAWAVMHWLLIVPCALLGSCAFRIRGGLLEDKHLRGQVSRAAWGLACLLTTWTGLWSLQAWWLALIVGLLAWVSTMDGLHHSIDMGKSLDVEDKGEQRVWVRFLRDFAWGHLHGLVLGSAVAIPFAYVHWGCWRAPVCPPWALSLWWLPLAGGAAWGLAYAFADWVVPDWSFLRRLHIGDVPLGKAGNAPEGAELIFGLEFAAFLFFAASP